MYYSCLIADGDGGLRFWRAVVISEHQSCFSAADPATRRHCFPWESNIEKALESLSSSIWTWQPLSCTLPRNLKLLDTNMIISLKSKVPVCLGTAKRAKAFVRNRPSPASIVSIDIVCGFMPHDSHLVRINRRYGKRMDESYPCSRFCSFRSCNCNRFSIDIL